MTDRIIMCGRQLSWLAKWWTLLVWTSDSKWWAMNMDLYIIRYIHRSSCAETSDMGVGRNHIKGRRRSGRGRACDVRRTLWGRFTVGRKQKFVQRPTSWDDLVDNYVAEGEVDLHLIWRFCKILRHALTCEPLANRLEDSRFNHFRWSVRVKVFIWLHIWFCLSPVWFILSRCWTTYASTYVVEYLDARLSVLLAVCLSTYRTSSQRKCRQK